MNVEERHLNEGSAGTTDARPVFSVRSRDGRRVSVIAHLGDPGDPPGLSISQSGTLLQAWMPSGEVLTLLVEITEVATSGVLVDPPKGGGGTVNR